MQFAIKLAMMCGIYFHASLCESMYDDGVECSAHV